MLSAKYQILATVGFVRENKPNADIPIEIVKMVGLYSRKLFLDRLQEKKFNYTGVQKVEPYTKSYEWNFELTDKGKGYDKMLIILSKGRIVLSLSYLSLLPVKKETEAQYAVTVSSKCAVVGMNDIFITWDTAKVANKFAFKLVLNNKEGVIAFAVNGIESCELLWLPQDMEASGIKISRVANTTIELK